MAIFSVGLELEREMYQENYRALKMPLPILAL
jgi:hypothetical protein